MAGGVVESRVWRIVTSTQPAWRSTVCLTCTFMMNALVENNIWPDVNEAALGMVDASRYE